MGTPNNQDAGQELQALVIKKAFAKVVSERVFQFGFMKGITTQSDYAEDDIHIYESLLHRFPELTSGQEIFNSCRYLSYFYQSRRSYSDSIYWGKYAFRKSHSSGIPTELTPFSEYYLGLANLNAGLYQDAILNFKNVASSFCKAIDSDKKDIDTRALHTLAMCYDDLATVYVARGQLQNAEDIWRRSQQLIGFMLPHGIQWQTSQIQFSQGGQENRESTLSELIFLQILTLSEIRVLQKRYIDAQALIEIAFSQQNVPEIDEEIGRFNHHLSFSVYHLFYARIFRLMNQPQLSEKHIARAREYCTYRSYSKYYSEHEIYAVILFELGHYYLSIDYFEKSKSHFLKALELWKMLRSPYIYHPFLASIYLGLSELAKKKGNTEAYSKCLQLSAKVSQESLGVSKVSHSISMSPKSIYLSLSSGDKGIHIGAINLNRQRT